jgi:hypothetical protein
LIAATILQTVFWKIKLSVIINNNSNKTIVVFFQQAFLSKRPVSAVSLPVALVIVSQKCLPPNVHLGLTHSSS